MHRQSEDSIFQAEDFTKTLFIYLFISLFISLFIYLFIYKSFLLQTCWTS